MEMPFHWPSSTYILDKGIMGGTIEVRPNTALADLDETLRALLKRELGRQGFDGVEISFDAPSRDWSGKLTGPTISLFLYDLREARDQAAISPSEQRGNGLAVVTPPSLRLEVTYAITAWSKAGEDEHRLLSQMISILHSYRELPPDLLAPRLVDAGTIETIVGRPLEEKSDFWTAVGGQYKPSVDFALRFSIASGASYRRGPEVRTQVVHTGDRNGPRGQVVELLRFGGTISDGDGLPITNAWMAIPALGVWTSSDSSGRFIFDRVRPGDYELRARTAAGAELEVAVSIPGDRVDLIVDFPTRKRRRNA
jgi:hypothetical protein